MVFCPFLGECGKGQRQAGRGCILWKYLEVGICAKPRLPVLCKMQNSLQIIDNADKLWYIMPVQLFDLHDEFANLNGVFNSLWGCE